MVLLMLFGLSLSPRIKDSINWERAKKDPYIYILPETATGFCIGAFIGTGSAYIFVALSDCSESDEMLACLSQVFFGFLAGYAVGSPLGVYLVGRNVKLKGRFTTAFFGSLVGMGISTFFLSMADNNAAMLTAAFISPPLVSSIVYSIDSDRMSKSNKSVFNLNIHPFSKFSSFSERDILKSGVEIVVSF